jgi:mRNA interferase MazF
VTPNMLRQGEVWWADLGDPIGSEPGYRRPVVVVQCDAFNASRIRTVVCVPLTSNLKWADAPGNVLLTSRSTGLGKDSVANVSQLLTLDRDALDESVGRLPRSRVDAILCGIDVMLGRRSVD